MRGYKSRPYRVELELRRSDVISWKLYSDSIQRFVRLYGNLVIRGKAEDVGLKFEDRSFRGSTDNRLALGHGTVRGCRSFLFFSFFFSLHFISFNYSSRPVLICIGVYLVPFFRLIAVFYKYPHTHTHTHTHKHISIYTWLKQFFLNPAHHLYILLRPSEYSKKKALGSFLICYGKGSH